MFRRQLWLPGDARQRLRDVLQPWQRQDLAALDTAWLELAGRTTRPDQECLRRAYIERPRGHSKTSDMAVQIAWILLAARQPVNGLAAAADRDQGLFLLDSLRRLASVNQPLLEPLQFLEHLVKNKQTGSRLDVISSDVKSSYGALPDFVICDEVSHWPRPEMWYSLLSSAAKKPRCVLTILTNAGVGRGWQWEIREHARHDSRWYFSSLDGPQAPWITEDWLAEQRALLPQPVYERLWLNRWQHAEGNFLTLTEVEACRNERRRYQLEGQPGRAYVAAIDYAEKHDFTVGCVCHREGELIVVDRMDVVKPDQNTPTRVAWVEDWIEDIASRFEQVRFVVDEYQLIGTIQRLENKYPVQRFRFSAGEGNHRLAVALRQLILHQRVQWYPGCGSVPGVHRDDLETELASLILRQSSAGKLRIDHVSDGQHHDDRAFTLGVACLTLNEESTGDFLLVTPPENGGGFGW
ncbi:Phage terminase-like protein, large subunit, contains N-terminal HTH domain [Planctomicrobium piriforme]|uniref:Phage terminase-like protein, large subunit, contains N-terminal HTH domain n=1 Tax=Planctomicrobium piriforme TaxID=1576369 RepID=A0A1I3DER6_9PLAN|nr:Phage terminase-like protein, large subunit, contains N-terminal HTH domain [Planctomicrobium piriforme]